MQVLEFALGIKERQTSSNLSGISQKQKLQLVQSQRDTYEADLEYSVREANLDRVREANLGRAREARIAAYNQKLREERDLKARQIIMEQHLVRKRSSLGMPWVYIPTYMIIYILLILYDCAEFWSAHTAN